MEEVIVETEDGKIFELHNIYDFELSYTKVGGWRLWRIGSNSALIAGQFDTPQIKRITINGITIYLQLQNKNRE